MEDRKCEGSHPRGSVKATMPADNPVLCRRHWKLQKINEQIRAYIEDNPSVRCPDHPDRIPQVTRWFSQSEPRLFCNAGIGQQVRTRPSGKGAFRMSSRMTYMQWCQWQAVIPPEILVVE